MKAGVEKIVGKIPTSGWGQVHEFVGGDDEKMKARGRLVVWAYLPPREYQDEGMRVVEEGREVLARVNELYFGETDRPVVEAMQKTWERVKGEFVGVELGGVA